jgi:thioredoxin reductase (NADPH)
MVGIFINLNIFYIQMARHKYDVIIIGAGPAGLSAALYCGRFKLKTLVLGEMLGGTVIKTSNIENYPGFNSIDGYDLAMKLKGHTLDYAQSVEIVERKVTKVEPLRDEGFTVMTQKNHYHSRALIIATGTKRRSLNILGDKDFEGKGVHYCAICDAPFYAGKTVAVIGGSDSAAKAALILADQASKVYLIYRGEKLRSEPVRTDHIEKNEKIIIIYNTNVTEILGDKTVHTLLLDTKYNDVNTLPVDGIFVEIGSETEVSIAQSLGLDINSKGEIKTDKEGETNTKGIFAAGDCTERKFKQIITAAAEGVSAAYSTYRFLNSDEAISYSDVDYEEDDENE